MILPYSSYSELSPQFASLYDAAPPLPDAEIIENALMLDTCSLQSIRAFPQSIKSYPPQVAFPTNCPLPGQDCLPTDMDNVDPFFWDSEPYAYEHDMFLGAPLLQFPQADLSFSPDAFSPGHHISYPNHSYTRMFRGRKSKAASEALDELRPYACDICQAAFARSHDRDRHKRSHTGETPYQCHGCGSGFKRPDARKRHWERDPMCAQEDWRRVQNTAEGAKRRARAKGRQLKPMKKTVRL